MCPSHREGQEGAQRLDAWWVVCRAEQRAASELDYITLRRILSPLQAAWLILESYPRKCDCLALSQAVSQLHEAAQPAIPPNWTGENPCRP